MDLHSKELVSRAVDGTDRRRGVDQSTWSTSRSVGFSQCGDAACCRFLMFLCFLPIQRGRRNQQKVSTRMEYDEEECKRVLLCTRWVRDRTGSAIREKDERNDDAGRRRSKEAQQSR